MYAHASDKKASSNSYVSRLWSIDNHFKEEQEKKGCNKYTPLIWDPKTGLMIHKLLRWHLYHVDPMLHQTNNAAYQMTV